MKALRSRILLVGQHLLERRLHLRRASQHEIQMKYRAVADVPGIISRFHPRRQMPGQLRLHSQISAACDSRRIARCRCRDSLCLRRARLQRKLWSFHSRRLREDLRTAKKAHTKRRNTTHIQHTDHPIDSTQFRELVHSNRETTRANNNFHEALPKVLLRPFSHPRSFWRRGGVPGERCCSLRCKLESL